MDNDLEPLIAARATAIFTGMSFLRTIGARLVRLAPGVAVIETEHRADLCQHHGVTHPGVLSGLADAACGLAAVTAQAADRDLVAVDLKINFVSQVDTGQVLRATGTAIRAGRTLTVCTAHLHAATRGHDERLIAIALATLMARPSNRSSPAAEEPGRG